MSSPTVSVVIPSKDRLSLLARAVSSVLNQTYPIEKIFVVFDGPMPQSLPSFPDKVTVLSTQTAQGACAARNVGLNLVNTGFIAFLDDDDEWMPEKIKIQMAQIIANPTVSVVGCSYVQVGEAEVQHIYEDMSISHEALKLWNALGSCSCSLLRTEQVKKIGGFDRALKSCQDWDLWFRLTKEFGPGMMLSQVLIRYHVGHSDRISKNLQKKIQGYCQFINKHRKDLGATLIAYHLLRVGKAVFDGVPVMEKIAKFMGPKIHNMLYKVRKISYPKPKTTIK